MNAIAWFIGGPFIYLALTLFICVTAWKVYGYATMPRHLRWDIYPVPHQGPEGSKYQKVDFYKATPHFDFISEALYMIPEILFIRKAFKHNFAIWRGSIAMHSGIYIAPLWIVALLAGACLEKTGTPVNAINGWPWITALYHVTWVSGAFCGVFGLLGSLFLLWMRLSDEGLRDMSDFVAFFNLFVMIALFGSVFLAWWFVDPSFALLRTHIATLLSFAPGVPQNGLITAELLFLGFFFAYLPFSRMTHYAAKYFFYHNIMWDDEPMKAGSSLEKNVIASLGQKVSWKAGHVKANGSWLDQVAPAGSDDPKGGTKGS